MNEKRLEYIPHDYQRYAKEWVIDHEASGLFLDMGLGKTVITLTAIEELIYDRMEVSKVLVIAPIAVAEDTWVNEVAKWEHLKGLRAVFVAGKNGNGRLERLNEEADIYILSNALVPWIVELYGKKWPFDMVVLDELSAFKSTDSKRFRALKKVRKLIKRVVGLTGTPAPNSLIEIWPQMYLLDYGERLGQRVTGFRQRYFYPKKYNGNIVYEYGLQNGAEEKIYDAISDICISMKAIDHLDMPERTDIEVKVKMSDSDISRYMTLERDFVLDIGDNEVVAVNSAVLSNKLLQLSQGAVYDEERNVVHVHDKKLEALERIVDESNGQPILVVFGFKHDFKRILEKFGTRYRVKEYEGSEDRLAWDNGEIDILCIHPSSCKYGLNLQSNHIMVWFTLTWSLEAYQQTVARLWRQGQKHRVSVYYLICEGTVDEKVMKVLSGKEKQQEALLEAVKAVVEKYK